jgi:5-methyltetrahydrofolate--homocysteine methyltransferase
MIVVGERINSSRSAVFKAIQEKDASFIRREAVLQADAGADYIDINAGLFSDNEPDCLAWLAERVLEATDLPLCIDSSNPDAIRRVLQRIGIKPGNKPMINSISLESNRYDALLPLVLERRCKIIALCQDSVKSAHSAEEKTDMACELIERLEGDGVPADDIYIDPLVYPLATDTGSARSTLEAFSSIGKSHPDVHLICGLTNVSFGLPERKLVNRSFLVASVVMGLDAAIIDPSDSRLMSALKAGVLISGRDPYSRGYIDAFRRGLFKGAG